MRAKYLPSEQRRAEAVEAVVELAAHTSPDTITTTEVAAQMKLTQGALFKHFPTKDALWQRVMEWVADQLLARIDRLAGGEADPLAAALDRAMAIKPERHHFAIDAHGQAPAMARHMSATGG